MDNEKATISSFFENVNKRILKKNGILYKNMQIGLAGKVLEIRYWDDIEVSLIRSSLLGRVLSKEQHVVPDAVIWCYTDDINIYIPDTFRDKPLLEGAITDVYQGKDTTGCIKVTRSTEMEGADYIRKTYYFCRQAGTDYDDCMLGHPLIRCFYFWAEQESLLILHSAAVGFNHKGVLISARGGAGKSTLSVSCLLEGLDFVADDYVMMREVGERKALPLYTMVGLNSDMYQILKPNMPVIKTEEKRNGKKFFDASAYPFQEELPIKAILCPTVTEGSEPMIVPTDRGSVLVKLVHSSVSQIGGRRDTEMVKRMMDRLKDLPVYEFRLSKDLKKNVTVLQHFMEGL
ncbi:hypothetical protein [Paenibacillus luteus]|uniref:hypothetical protein n=1 Tax=Paenibacillus luteus TaxID=2545753 RepID=UPI001144BA30|nr:hypothetical protein [Paenibacillus luteus]